MASFVTLSELRSASTELRRQGQLLAKSAQSEGKNVFLSHSTRDAEYLPAIVKLLENHGGRVYVDDKDGDLPAIPSVETASLLRASLLHCRRFVLFVTPNSKDSRWIPWELGLGDGQKGRSNVALLPAAHISYDQQWAELEYLGLYDRIVFSHLAGYTDPLWVVMDHHTNSGQRLVDWLSAF
jgi:hypothetical protein